jgi:hypothetical protein
VNGERTRVHESFTTPEVAPGTLAIMEPSRDEPLPATLAFVSVLGVLILVGWFAMYFLLRARW